MMGLAAAIAFFAASTFTSLAAAASFFAFAIAKILGSGFAGVAGAFVGAVTDFAGTAFATAFFTTGLAAAAGLTTFYDA